MIFSCFTQKLKENVGGLLGGQRVCWPPLSNYWGGLAPPPLPTPMLNETSGPSCSKLMTSLDNVVYKFKTLIFENVLYLKKYEKVLLFFHKNISLFRYKVIIHLTSLPPNELIKLKMLALNNWT